MKKKEENQIKKMLNNIVICMYILIVLVGVLLIVVVAGFQGNKEENNETTTPTANTEDTSENEEYDVSGFNTMSTEEIISAIDTHEYKVIYVGREGCGYCVKFIDPMMEAQSKLGFKHIYLDLTTMTSEDMETFSALDEDIKEDFGATPMIVVTKDNEVVGVRLGYSEAASYIDFLNSTGIK